MLYICNELRFFFSFCILEEESERAVEVGE